MKFAIQNRIFELSQVIEYARQNGYSYVVNVLDREVNLLKQREQDYAPGTQWTLKVNPKQEVNYAR